MTYWGYLLLAAFVALGLTERLTWRKAGKTALIVTVVAILVAFANIGGLR
ncbi:MAG: hypothetical protein JO046_20825 [Solirubrobacterales bacterium]|nr:hypothetical protein [Solirubrobacterales bacterium]MBV9684247.1 hypothetical protein [Solirubrobacterales bacterium]